MEVAIFRKSIPLTIFSVFHVTHDFCDARPVRNTEKWPKNAFWAPPNAGAVRLWSLSSRGRCRNPPAYGKKVRGAKSDLSAPSQLGRIRAGHFGRNAHLQNGAPMPKRVGAPS